MSVVLYKRKWKPLIEWNSGKLGCAYFSFKHSLKERLNTIRKYIDIACLRIVRRAHNSLSTCEARGCFRGNMNVLPPHPAVSRSSPLFHTHRKNVFTAFRTFFVVLEPAEWALSASFRKIDFTESVHNLCQFAGFFCWSLKMHAVVFPAVIVFETSVACTKVTTTAWRGINQKCKHNYHYR